MLIALVGFLAPFIPDLLGMGKGWLDHKQELEAMRLRAELAREEHAYRLEEIRTQADMADMREARRPHKSYGVQLLDKAGESQGMLWRWVFNLAFASFAFLDWIIASVRPGITYWAFGLYALSKAAGLVMIYPIAAKYSDGAVDALFRVLHNEAAFTAFDQDMLILVLTFWFGNRLRNGRSNQS